MAGRIDYTDPQALRNPRVDQNDGTGPVSSTQSWDFDASGEGWTATVGSTISWTSENAMNFIKHTSTSSADAVYRQSLTLTASDYNFIRMRIRISTEGDSTGWVGKFQWRRPADGSFSGQTSRIARPEINQFGEQWHFLEWDVSGHEDWNGTIEQLQFLPYNTADNIIDIDYIRLEAM
jgi:hypothetical protein